MNLFIRKSGLDFNYFKRKRGRPKNATLPSRKGRRMSEKTKKKISENNKKFSICKLCSKQCRGFRGLVDHMHRDHSDYRPWKCHICEEKTAFVKTLYRHLKTAHDVHESPCPRCGKTYSRAQSMLHHVTKVLIINISFKELTNLVSAWKRKD